MANKVITFIGVDDYMKTHYRWKEQTSDPTRYFHMALKQFFPDYTIIVLVTNEASSKHKDALKGFGTPHIDEVVSDDEMWNAFEIIRQQVQPGDRIVFDITHSFRSLPFLALLTLAYLRVIQDFDLEAVIYAPYKDYAETPAYDLRRFVDLLDWTTATHLFLQTGYASDLVTQLQAAEWVSGNIPDLEKVSAALRLARPDEARDAAWAWAQLDIEPNDLKIQARPFGLLIQRVQKEFSRIASDSPDQSNLKQELEQELALIDWNLSRGQILSAVTVAREWLVSLLCWLVGWTAPVDEQLRDAVCQVGEWRSRKGREKAEKVLKALKDLSSLASDDRESQAGSKMPGARDFYHDHPDLAMELGKTWGAISALRNDLDHAGKIHSTEPRSLDQIIAEVAQLKAQLQTLAQQATLSTPW